MADCPKWNLPPEEQQIEEERLAIIAVQAEAERERNRVLEAADALADAHERTAKAYHVARGHVGTFGTCVGAECVLASDALAAYRAVRPKEKP